MSFPVTRGSGPRDASATLVFPRQVTSAVAAMRGYQVGFVADDHHVGLLQVELQTEINANVVVVRGKLGCRDWSGNWDDEYNGSILAGVLVDMVPANTPPPRGDVLIEDMEVSQATQFFRSAEHLDAANVMPDNSMPLVSGKSVGLRYYVDWDPTAGTPLAILTGEVTLRSGGATTTIAPMRTILPRRSSEIDRRQVDHTLNFAVPAAWCRGRLEISCEVFDARNPSPRSATFRRTLQFVDVNPLRVYGVGINYTGGGLNLPAPTLADVLTTFDYTRRVWPTGDVLTSGFTDITFSQSLAGVAADGCGDGFNALLDELQDMKGDTDDLVYGLLPNGTPLTGVGGCGGGGAGTGLVGDGVTAAHEAGHAVGRKHAPCNDSARCGSPRNTDDNFPDYGNYVSDSIGEMGFDASANRVFDPAMSSDFMGYSGNDWISPYTYKALFKRGDPVASSGARRMFAYSFNAAAADDGRARADSGRPEWIKRRSPLLFLSAYADGETVKLRPSFTYDAYLRRPGQDTDYEVHLLGSKDEVLACVPLQQACGACDSGCGPVALRGEVPWSDDAAKLEIRHDGKVLETYPVEGKPVVKCECAREDKGDIRVSWSASPDKEKLWYLVQWRDRDGTWRGCAPRTQETSLIVSKRLLWATKDELRLRVLAVALLNTGSAECKIEAHRTEPPNDTIVRPVPGGIRATSVDPTGRSLSADDLRWFDDKGGEIAAGADFEHKPGRAGFGIARRIAQGVTGVDGFGNVDPGENGKPDCGCRPAGGASARVTREAGFYQKDEQE